VSQTCVRITLGNVPIPVLLNEYKRNNSEGKLFVSSCNENKGTGIRDFAELIY